MRPLAVVVLNVLRDRASEMSLTEEHQLIQALGLDREHLSRTVRECGAAFEVEQVGGPVSFTRGPSETEASASRARAEVGRHRPYVGGVHYSVAVDVLRAAIARAEISEDLKEVGRVNGPVAVDVPRAA